MAARLTGLVKSWHAGSGFGFIDGGRYDYFCHVSELENCRRLDTSDMVTFVPAPSAKRAGKMEAKKVQFEGKGRVVMPKFDAKGAASTAPLGMDAASSTASATTKVIADPLAAPASTEAAKPPETHGKTEADPKPVSKLEKDTKPEAPKVTAKVQSEEAIPAATSAGSARSAGPLAKSKVDAPKDKAQPVQGASSPSKKKQTVPPKRIDAQKEVDPKSSAPARADPKPAVPSEAGHVPTWPKDGKQRKAVEKAKVADPHQTVMPEPHNSATVSEVQALDSAAKAPTARGASLWSCCRRRKMSGSIENSFQCQLEAALMLVRSWHVQVGDGEQPQATKKTSAQSAAKLRPKSLSNPIAVAKEEVVLKAKPLKQPALASSLPSAARESQSKLGQQVAQPEANTTVVCAKASRSKKPSDMSTAQRALPSQDAAALAKTKTLQKAAAVAKSHKASLTGSTGLVGATAKDHWNLPKVAAPSIGTVTPSTNDDDNEDDATSESTQDEGTWFEVKSKYDKRGKMSAAGCLAKYATTGSSSAESALGSLSAAQSFTSRSEAPRVAVPCQTRSSFVDGSRSTSFAGQPKSSFDETAKAGSSRICLTCAANRPCGKADTRLFHQANAIAPVEAGVTVSSVTIAKLRLLQDRWEAARGRGRLVRAWQIRNPSLEYRFAATQHNFAIDQKPPDVIDGWHGSLDRNILSIATHGFDPSRRCGQVYGAGEYFAKDPNVSIGYTHGGHFLFLCKLLLGAQDVDHTWVNRVQYYVLKQANGNVQVQPLYVLQFQDGNAALPVVHELQAMQPPVAASISMGQLHEKMKGAKWPEPGRMGDMTEARTNCLWVGWLDPALRLLDDEEIAKDVKEFLRGFHVGKVIPERNGARLGAFVCLTQPATREEVNSSKSQLLYHGCYSISIDDAQPVQAQKALRPCPRLRGPGKCCRSWNLAGHFTPQYSCPFSHSMQLWCTFRAESLYEDVPSSSAKFHEISEDLLSSAPFHNGQPRILRIRRMRNRVLEDRYRDRAAYTKEKQREIVEKELWHGTNPAALENLRVHGFQPPSDRKASKKCPRSGGKGLCTTLCDQSCEFCVEPHAWDKCHMYGLGIYFADLAAKSHRYTSPTCDERGRRVHTLLRCRVLLGRPYLIEGALVQPDAMHNVVECVDPSDMLDNCVEEWNPVGHDSYYIKGLQTGMTPGRSVYNTEFVIFNGQQALPLYRIDYVLE